MSAPNQEPSSLELAQAAAKGDVRAFELMVRPHLSSIRRVAYSFCRNWTEADDLAQEALLKAFRSISTFVDGSACAPWLFAVTRSVCLDWYRKHKRAALVEFDEAVGVPDDNDAAALPIDPERVLETKTELVALWNAVRKLEPEFRIPLVLFEIEGMSYDDIARVEQVPVGTVRSRLARARATLQQLLEDETLAPSGTLSLRPSSSVVRGPSPRGPPSPARTSK